MLAKESAPLENVRDSPRLIEDDEYPPHSKAEGGLNKRGPKSKQHTYMKTKKTGKQVRKLTKANQGGYLKESVLQGQSVLSSEVNLKMEAPNVSTMESNEIKDTEPLYYKDLFDGTHSNKDEDDIFGIHFQSLQTQKLRCAMQSLLYVEGVATQSKAEIPISSF